MNKNYINSQEEADETLSIREELEKYIIHWKWFALSISISLVLAFLYLRYTPSQYNAKTSILIHDKKSGVSNELAPFQDLGILGGAKGNIDNEIEIIKSRKIIGEAVKRLNLTILYYTESRVAQTEIYKPIIKIDFLNKDSQFYNFNLKFIISSISETQFELKSEEGNLIGVYNFNKKLNTEFGSFKVSYNIDNLGIHTNFEYIVRVLPLSSSIDGYRGQLKIEPVNKQSSVLNLSLNNAVKQKAIDFLNMLVFVYNQDAISDKNQVALKTQRFINDRLLFVGKNLDSINNNLKDFKTKNKLTDIKAESQLVLENFSSTTNNIVEVTIQLKLVQSLNKDLLNSDSKNHSLLATNLGINDLSIATAITEYNNLVLAKMRLEKTASDINPQIVRLKTQIEGVKSSLIQSLINSEKNLQLTLEQLKKQENKIKAKISGVPVQELELRDIRLQQNIIAGLYTYLLNKKEETAISLAVTVPNAKIIDLAYGSGVPISPKRKITYLFYLFFGFFIPFVIIYIKNLLDTKIHNKKDIENNLSIPFLGDVPKSELKEKIVIGVDARSSTAEAFRLIRTNLDFMLTNKKGKSKTIFITSTISGEGKSFISINVAASLALSGKKVLLMGMDLRAPKVTEYLGLPDRKGVTNYITDDDLDLENLIFNIEDIKNLDIISSGVVPPNPAELLMTKRTENLFTIIKEEYDYIIVDTAPVNLVTDTLLIAKYADMFMYVARANYLDKRLLAIPQNLYNEKRLPNMAMILNDTDPKRSYGYGYGGYGYGYVVVEKPWYKKIFNRS